MKYLKNLSLSFLYIIIPILTLTFLITILSYFNIINDKVVSIFKILIPIISILIGSIYIGKHSKKKGFLEGLKLGVIFSLFLIIFNIFVFNNFFKLKYLLFYTIIIITSILGSMIGINSKKVD